MDTAALVVSLVGALNVAAVVVTLRLLPRRKDVVRLLEAMPLAVPARREPDPPEPAGRRSFVGMVDAGPADLAERAEEYLRADWR